MGIARRVVWAGAWGPFAGQAEDCKRADLACRHSYSGVVGVAKDMAGAVRGLSWVGGCGLPLSWDATDGEAAAERGRAERRRCRWEETLRARHV